MGGLRSRRGGETAPGKNPSPVRPFVVGGAGGIAMAFSILASLPAVTATARIAYVVVATLAATVVATGEALERSRQRRQRAPEEAIRPAGALPPPRDLSQLPGDAGIFVGRAGELARVKSAVVARPGVSAVPVVTISGPGGSGKTTLAVKAAHEIRHRFPDGQLYVDLRGSTRSSADASDVLAAFLRELGIDRAAVPESLEERSRLYRARLDRLRVLVVLDNAANESQVRPLLPGTSSCGVIVTSRVTLGGLLGTVQLPLDTMSDEAAFQLFRAIIGQERIAREPDAAREIVALSGRLPFAVHIAGARLAGRPYWSLAGFVARLRDERNRLAEFTVGDLEVRASLGLSYDALSAAEQVAFRAIGFLATPDFPLWAVAALVDVPIGQAEALLEHLVDNQLVIPGTPNETAALSRFRLHDLVRAYARERAEATDPRSTLGEAVGRTLRAYTALAEQAYLTTEPGDIHKPRRPAETDGPDSTSWWPVSDPALLDDILRDPAGWFVQERTCLIAAAEQAFRLGQNELAVQLTLALYGSFRVGAHWTSWRRLYALALDVCRQSDDRYAEAEVLLRLGDVYKNSGRVDGPGGTPIPDREDLIAATLMEQSRTAFQRLEMPVGEVAVLRRLGGIYRDLGSYEQAARCYEQGLATAVDLPDADLARAYLLRGHSALLRMSGHPEKAIEGFAEALEVFRRHGDLRGEAGALRGIGECWLLMEEWDKAHSCFTERLRLARTDLDAHSEAHALRGLGEACLGRGDLDAAVGYFAECLPIFEEIGHRSSTAETLDSTGRAHAEAGRRAQARAAWHRSLEIYESQGMPQALIVRQRIEGDRLTARWLRAWRTWTRHAGAGQRIKHPADSVMPVAGHEDETVAARK